MIYHGVFFAFIQMVSISKTGSLMPESPIRKLTPFAEKAKLKGTKVYHLNIGQPDINTPSEMLNAIKNIDRSILEYSPSTGFDSYRKKLVQYYSKHNIEIDYHDLLTTTGGSEAIFFGFMTCLNSGDEIIVPEPFYANYNGFATASGVIIKPVISYIDDEFSLPSINEIKKIITPKTRGILICNPNNPTGYLYTKEELFAIKDITLKYDLFFFADEVYREFCYDGKTHHSILNLPGLEEHAVVFDSISKRFSACGARIGAIISRNKNVISTALKFAQSRLSPPTLGQIAAEASLDVDKEYFIALKKEYESRRDLVVSELNKMPGVVCPNPSGAFYTIAKLPIDDCDKFCQWLLESFSYKKQTVMLAPATGFYTSKGLGIDEVRVAYVLNTSDTTKAMECLAIALQEYPR